MPRLLFFSTYPLEGGIEFFKSCLSMIKELLKTYTCMIHSLDLFRMPSSLKKGVWWSFFRASNGSYRSLHSDFLFARVIRVIVLWRVRFILRLRQSELHYLSVITESTTLGVISQWDSISFEYWMITLLFRGNRQINIEFFFNCWDYNLCMKYALVRGLHFHLFIYFVP